MHQLAQKECIWRMKDKKIWSMQKRPFCQHKISMTNSLRNHCPLGSGCLKLQKLHLSK
uniref:Uncharacterized protein n=1 Tax=Lepeophtheirus salmonis TaxID=72036 RepID=A0A0K2U811_LEPSM